jgi:exodeoxyribonuclease V alpha subunit
MATTTSTPTKTDYRQVARQIDGVGLTTAQIRAAFDRLSVADGDTERDGSRVALATLAQSERDFADHFARLLSAPASELPLDEALLDGLHTNQADAVRNAMSHRITVVTGGPGTGKTHTTNQILRAFDDAGLTAKLAAPTGKAAIRMKELTGRDASTIHRLLKYHPHMGFRYNVDAPVVLNDAGSWVSGGPVPANVIIVDEASMVDSELAAALVRGLADGTRIVIVGDVDQLPSVGAGRVLSDLIESGVVPVARLTHIFRQAADSPIPHFAAAINTGNAAAVVDFLSAGHAGLTESAWADEVGDVVRTVVEKVTTASVAARDIQVLCPQKGQGCGVEELNVALKAALNPGSGETPMALGGGYQAHVHDKVIHVQNNYALSDEERGFDGTFNGEIGYIVEGAAGGLQDVGADVIVSATDLNLPIVAVVDYGDRRVGYNKHEAKELRLAYAVTGHKYQGSQARHVVIPVHQAHQFTLTRAWLYTAVTRASESVTLVGQLQAVTKAAGNTRGVRRGTKLVALLKEAC